jgi:hypothetical protein
MATNGLDLNSEQQWSQRQQELEITSVTQATQQLMVTSAEKNGKTGESFQLIFFWKEKAGALPFIKKERNYTLSITNHLMPGTNLVTERERQTGQENTRDAWTKSDNKPSGNKTSQPQQPNT